MLARRSTLALRNGRSIDLPLLVPSFSSKGFMPIVTKKRGGKKGDTGFPELEARWALANEFLEKSFLVSAYDIHHSHLAITTAQFKKPRAIFVDSGGYELDAQFDETEPVVTPHSPKIFQLEDYINVLNGLPKKAPIVAANFDWSTKEMPLPDQIASAQELFAQFPDITRNFLVKPTQAGELLDVDEIVRHVKDLSAFDIVGVTEKELGRTLIERLENLASLRAGMDRQKIRLPIRKRSHPGLKCWGK